MNQVTFVLGGARSGKSRYAEGLAAKHRGRKTYIATAQAFDDEMRGRIAKHRHQRGVGWETCEAPLDLAEALAACKAGFVLIDCITVWIGNLMHHGRGADAEITRLCEALARSKSRIVVVSNEVGSGIVPENALARAFRDQQGIANQRIAEVADEVIFVTAGLPRVLKKARNKRAPTAKARSWRGRKG
ncbi:MAG: bifunctional adenosylcobinamide kinase/adenosylcobinamide-phosphate guanylyltransferase [Aestuariivirga sp.]